MASTTSISEEEIILENIETLPKIDDLSVLSDFPELKKRNKILLEILPVALFSILSFTLGMIFLNDYIAPGTDGGYYELQTATLINEGKLYYKSPVLIFLITALFSLISGSTTFGVTFSASLFFAAAVVTNYFAAKITWNKKVAFLTLPFSALSVLLLRMSTDFMKNLLAMVFVPIALASFNRYHLKREWKYFVLSIVFSFLTMGTHLMTSLALSVSLVCYFVVYHLFTTIEEKKFNWKTILFSAILLLSIAASMGLMWIFNEYAIPIKETNWDYSSNTLPDGSSSYVPSDDGSMTPLGSLFRELPKFESFLLIFFLIFTIGTLAITKSKKERNGMILLFNMFVPLWLLGVSLDVDGWLQRMAQDMASFLILASAFSFSYLILGLEKFVQWLEKRSKKFSLGKFKPQLSFVIILSLILIIPLIFNSVAMGKSLKPILTEDEVRDLKNIKGQLPTNDSLLYGEHGLEYWASLFTGYECQKLNFGENQLEDLYDLLNVSSPPSYLLLYKARTTIPIVEEGTGPYTADTFTLYNPINGSIQTHPVVVKCITPPGSTVSMMHYKLKDYKTKVMISDHELNSYAIGGGYTEWNFTLPSNIPNVTYSLELESNYYIVPGNPLVERLLIIYHHSEPAFNTVYIGKIYAIVEHNPSYVFTPIPVSYYDISEPINQYPDINAPAPPLTEAKPAEKILTFILLIRFPFLSDYLHYYIVIPLAVVYWSLLLFGSYRVVRLIINQIKKRKSREIEE
ncbi:MAG: hypothetical protein FK734_09660 [Asgard group archaeon]|nr:hypothetical protein [Asgard group archaeon]